MNLDTLVEAELKRHNWSHMMEIAGPATNIPFALRELFSAKTPHAANGAHWKLENHVVVQGQLFEVAISVVPVLLAALVNPDRPRFVRIGILELLFLIVSGTAHEDEKERGLVDLDERCKRAAKDGLWLLYREYLVGEREAAKEIIEIIDDDTSRLPFLDRMLLTL